MLRHLPNALSGLRLLAAPALALLLIHDAYAYAFGLFALAGLSDAADGYLAKRLAFGSRFGAYLDPAADKLLMLVSFITLTVLKVTPLWLTLVVIARDAAIVGGIVLARILDLPIRVAPLLVGKASTAMQIAYIALALLMLTFGFRWPTIESIAAYATAFLTIASWIAYGGVGVKALMRRRGA